MIHGPALGGVVNNYAVNMNVVSTTRGCGLFFNKMLRIFTVFCDYTKVIWWVQR